MSENEEIEVEIPPAVAAWIDSFKKMQKELMRDKSYANADQLRKAMSLNVMEAVAQLAEMIGVGMSDLHNLTVSNAQQLNRQRRWFAEQLRKAGVEVNDGEAFVNVGVDELNSLGQALYALATYLTRALPNDKEASGHFNEVMSRYNVLTAALMGNQSVPDEEDEEEEDEEDEEESAPEPSADGDGSDPGESEGS
jgi:post-segregation antitoxin (ccd killing protein)